MPSSNLTHLITRSRSPATLIWAPQTGCGLGSMITSADGFGHDQLVVSTESGHIQLSLDDLSRENGDLKMHQVLCANNQLALAFYERANGRKGAMAYQLPQLEQIQKLTLHECFGGIFISENVVAVYTSAAIRVLKFESLSTAKLVKTVEVKGISSGCCSIGSRGKTLLLSTASEYMLLDLKTSQLTPLFPIVSGVKPMMCAVHHDFLVVQGTSMEEPAMGLFVDRKGDVARMGLVVQWDAYPTSMCHTQGFLLAVVQNKLVGMRLHEQSIEPVDLSAEQDSVLTDHQHTDTSLNDSDKLETEDVAFVQYLSFRSPITSKLLLNRLGDPQVSKVYSQVAIVYNSGNIAMWIPPVKPQLVVKEELINKNELTAIDPDPEQSSSHQGVVELEYLSQYLALHLLSAGKPNAAIKEWHSCQLLDPEVVLYIFHESGSSKMPEVYPGLVKLVEQLRTSRGGPRGEAFLLPYLRMKLKALRRNPSTAYTSKKLELVYAKYLDDAELIRFLLSKDLKARTEVLDWLQRHEQFKVLVEYFKLSGNRQRLANLYFDILKSSKKLPKELINEAANALASELSEYTNLWDLMLMLVSMPNKEKQAMRVITTPQFEQNYAFGETLEALKLQTDSGLLWRQYLKYLVHEKNMFTNDLAALVVADLMECYSHHTTEIADSYQRFANLGWPKPTYQQWVSTLRAEEYPTDLLALQTELWEVIRRLTPETESTWLISSLSSQMDLLKDELAMLYQKLGIHEQALELLAEITDYRSIIEYATSKNDESMQRDLAQISLRMIGHCKEQYVLKEFLLTCSQHLTAQRVMESLPSTTPVYVVADFMTAKLGEAQRKVNLAGMRHAVSKAASND